MTPKKAFDDQRRHAVAREVPWYLAYSDWLEMWLLSGKWLCRGKRKGQYQMCRKGDTGGYSIRNCYIATVEVNQAERHNISDTETAAIIEEYQSSILSQCKIGERYGLSQSSISRIVNGLRRRNTSGN